MTSRRLSSNHSASDKSANRRIIVQRTCQAVRAALEFRNVQNAIRSISGFADGQLPLQAFSVV